MRIMQHLHYAVCVLCQMSAELRVPEIGMHRVPII